MRRNPACLDLFADDRRALRLDPGAVLLGGFALDVVTALLDGIAAVRVAAPLRHMETPGGWRMSVAMTNCGVAGWTTSRRGYRYTGHDPVSGQAWPPMPLAFRSLATRAATAAGYADFDPDASSAAPARWAPRPRRCAYHLIRRPARPGPQRIRHPAAS